MVFKIAAAAADAARPPNTARASGVTRRSFSAAIRRAEGQPDGVGHRGQLAAQIALVGELAGHHRPGLLQPLRGLVSLAACPGHDIQILQHRIDHRRRGRLVAAA